MNLQKPQQSEYPAYYHKYICLTNGNNIKELIHHHSYEIINFINALPNDKANYAYAPEKWTIKELLQHLIDTERIFIYRALRFARKDNQPLLGFEEDDYVKYSNTGSRTLENLKEEFIALRTSSDIFLASLSQEQLKQTGTANNQTITVNAIAFICFGHLIHHLNIIKERYL